MIIHLKKYGNSARVFTTRQKPQNPRFWMTVTVDSFFNYNPFES